MQQSEIIKISGPLVVAKNIGDVRLYDTVYVSNEKLLGEIIEVRGNEASIQVYEETSGIGLHEPVYTTKEPLSIELGPGLLSQMLDGIGRDLNAFSLKTGAYLQRGVSVPTLSRDTKWHFHPLVSEGDEVNHHDRLGYVIENETFKHYILVPAGVEGVVQSIKEGDYTLDDIVVRLAGKKKTHALTMVQRWPIRLAREYQQKQLPTEPLITGQRVIDTFFPVTKGGTACIPGPFGSGKTVVQHQLAKWADSDVVVYIGCGERGNEMTDVLNEFPEIIDPKTKAPLMNKTVLIANTSNMPVAAREASIYTGMSIAEYFRDMGYHVAMMADSTSRWAEALREMSGRLQEMPGDEGYPAYLNSRLAQVYERAGIVQCYGEGNKTGSVTMIGAVSPAGGDLSEPVTQATLQITKVFWALDATLAYARHFPAINWLKSYSLYQDVVDKYMRKYINKTFPRYRIDAIVLLKEEQRLNEIVQLIGKDTLADEDLLKLEVARMLREDFLSQNAFQQEDTYTSLKKQTLMLSTIMEFYHDAKEALLQDHIFVADLLNISGLEKLSRMKYLPESECRQIEQLRSSIKQEISSLKVKGDESYEGV